MHEEDAIELLEQGILIRLEFLLNASSLVRTLLTLASLISLLLLYGKMIAADFVADHWLFCGDWSLSLSSRLRHFDYKAHGVSICNVAGSHLPVRGTYFLCLARGCLGEIAPPGETSPIPPSPWRCSAWNPRWGQCPRSRFPIGASY